MHVHDCPEKGRSSGLDPSFSSWQCPYCWQVRLIDYSNNVLCSRMPTGHCQERIAGSKPPPALQGRWEYERGTGIDAVQFHFSKNIAETSPCARIHFKNVHLMLNWNTHDSGGHVVHSCGSLIYWHNGVGGCGLKLLFRRLGAASVTYRIFSLQRPVVAVQGCLLCTYGCCAFCGIPLLMCLQYLHLPT